MTFHIALLLLEVCACLTRHIVLSLCQIYTLTEDFGAACRQRAIKIVMRSLNQT